MIPLAIDRKWGGGWRTRQSGAAVVSVSDDVLTTTAAAGEPAMKDYYVPIYPGTVIEAEVMGRRISGRAGLYLDTINANGSGFITVDSVELTGTDWQRLRLRWIAPWNLTQAFARVVVGVTTANAGDARWFDPVIRVGHAPGGALVLARGFIRLRDGVVDLHPDFLNHGVAGVSFNGTTTVQVALEGGVMNWPHTRPTVLVSGTPDDELIPLAGQVTGGDAPSFTVRWTNGTSIQDVSTGTRYAFFVVVW